jgi:hypothetical protein
VTLTDRSSLARGLRVARACARWLLAFLFAMACSYKLLNFTAFYGTVVRVEWLTDLPGGLLRFVAGAVVGLEAFLAWRFASGSEAARRVAPLAMLALTVFTAAILTMSAVECSCYWQWMPGQSNDRLVLGARNAVIISLCIVVAWKKRGVPDEA